MNNTNPFIPQGSILEQQSKRRSRLKLAVFCVLAVAVTGLSVMLIQGCKREQPADTTDMSTPTIDTNLVANAETNPPVVDTNPPVVTPPTVVAPPPVTPVVAPPVETGGGEYVVVKGDYLAAIAKKNGVSLKALEAANPNVAPTKLRIGQKLVIPGGSAAAPAAVDDSTSGSATSQTYVVKSGDTLSKIARTHHTTVKALQAANNLATTSIKKGQKLKIPVKAAVAPAPMPEAAPVESAPAAPATLPAAQPAQQ